MLHMAEADRAIYTANFAFPEGNASSRKPAKEYCRRWSLPTSLTVFFSWVFQMWFCDIQYQSVCYLLAAHKNHAYVWSVKMDILSKVWGW